MEIIISKKKNLSDSHCDVAVISFVSSLSCTVLTNRLMPLRVGDGDLLTGKRLEHLEIIRHLKGKCRINWKKGKKTFSLLRDFYFVKCMKRQISRVSVVCRSSGRLISIQSIQSATV